MPYDLNLTEPVIECLNIPSECIGAYIQSLCADELFISLKKSKDCIMQNEFTAIIEKDGEWLISYCPEIPGANGQGRTQEECLKSLSDAIKLILEDRREDAFRGIPDGAIKEMISIV